MTPAMGGVRPPAGPVGALCRVEDAGRLAAAGRTARPGGGDVRASRHHLPQHLERDVDDLLGVGAAPARGHGPAGSAHRGRGHLDQHLRGDARRQVQQFGVHAQPGADQHSVLGGVPGREVAVECHVHDVPGIPAVGEVRAGAGQEEHTAVGGPGLARSLDRPLGVLPLPVLVVRPDGPVQPLLVGEVVVEEADTDAGVLRDARDTRPVEAPLGEGGTGDPQDRPRGPVHHLRGLGHAPGNGRGRHLGIPDLWHADRPRVGVMGAAQGRRRPSLRRPPCAAWMTDS